MKQSTIIVVIGGAVLLGALVIFGVNMQSVNNTQSNTALETQPSITPMEAEQEKSMNTKNIVEVAVENGNFKTLVAAVQAAGLAETLSGEGPFTVFAPTDEAFAKLPQGTVEGLLQDKEKLAQILTYHVVSGKVMAKDVVGMSSAKTVQGSDVAIKVDGNTVMINNATVTMTDIEASNGVIHVIDTVLMPQ